MSHNLSQESFPTSFDRRLHFLETELVKKEQKVESFRIMYENGLMELSQTKIELSVAKSYINTLPTQQEVVKLKNTLSDLNEQKQQITADFLTLKELNSNLNSKILALLKEVKEKDNALQRKIAEIDALQYTVKQWENRRKLALEAGQVTVEDIVADKIKLQEQFEDMLKIASCREQYFKARIDKMKAQVDKQKLDFDAQKESCIFLHSEIKKLEIESKKSRLERKLLIDAKEQLEVEFNSVKFELEQLNAHEVIRKKTEDSVRICIAGISKCQKSLNKLLIFIKDAIAKQFLDPSLLFSADDCLKFETEDGENLKELAEKRVSEIEALNKLTLDCQKNFIDIYVSNLSNSVDSQCQVQ